MDIMLDIETLGRRDDAVVVSIGAVAFEPLGNGISDSFYCVIGRDWQQREGRTMDAGTVEWWMMQSEPARKVFSDNTDPQGIAKFVSWMGSLWFSCVWGNGSDFDNRILGNLCEQMNGRMPWKYFNNRCYRTLKNLFPDIKCPKPAVAHHALHDATAQALHLQEIMRALKSV